VKAEAAVATDCVDAEKKFHFAIWRLSQWAHVGDEPLTPSPIGIGLELSAVWTVRFSARSRSKEPMGFERIDGMQRPSGKIRFESAA
jgi:hypothetical protein